MKIKLSILFLLSIILFGCKKYPEDESLVHLRNPERRLKHFRPWKIIEYKVDNVDSLGYINQKFSWIAPIENLENYFKGATFINHSNEIITGWEYIPVYNNTTWTILRLDRSYFIIKKMDGGKEYYLKLKSKRI